MELVSRWQNLLLAGLGWFEQTWVFLVLGFGPFRQHLVNSSWEAVKVNPALGQPGSFSGSWKTLVCETPKKPESPWREGKQATLGRKARVWSLSGVT